MAEPDYNPMEEPVRQQGKKRTGLIFFVLMVAAGGIFSWRAYSKQKTNEEIARTTAIALNVIKTETAQAIPFTLTPSQTASQTFTPTASITTTPATPSYTPTPSQTATPKIIYQDRTIVITVRVPFVITQVVKETVLVTVVVTPTDTPSPTPSDTPTVTGTPPSPTPSPTPSDTPTATEEFY